MSPTPRTCRPASERALRATAACFFAAALFALLGALVARLPGLVASAACFTLARGLLRARRQPGRADLARHRRRSGPHHMIPTPTTSAARTVCAGGLALTLLLAGCGGGDPQASAAALAASAAVDLADQESAQAAALAAVNDIERALRLHAWRDTAEAAGALLDSPLAAHLDGDAHWSARRAQLIALGMQGDVEQLERDWSAAVDEQVDAGRLAAAAGTICGLRGGDDAGDSALLVWLLSRVGTAHDAFLAGTIVPPEEIGKVDAWRARTAEAARRAALPESHADAFPRAWLAPIAPPADAR